MAGAIVLFALGLRQTARVEPWLLESREDAGKRHGELVYHSTGQMPSFVGLGSGEYQAASAFAFWIPTAIAFGPDIDIYRLRRDR